ncbi:MAG: BamA/TamA family outer membrane protein [Bacteroidales bacterium]|nr:BamA/TamA family outer membrane protein [Candidatus Equibacterium intestinale]
MKRIFTLIIASALFAVSMQAQEGNGPANSQEINKESKKTQPKTGWNFGFLPAVSYSSDLGLQYGALCDIYCYSDGKQYPGYYHKFNVEISTYTKGMSTFHVFYDSKYLIPGIRVTSAVTYQPDGKYSFYGFNGYESKFDYDAPNSFYFMRRNTFRALADFQGEIIKGSGLRWAAGLTFWDYKTGATDAENVDISQTLYGQYVNAGVISRNEADGGRHIEVKYGIVYDTRDIEAAPTRGIWAELYGTSSPDIFGTGYHYTRAIAHWRQYVPLASDKLVFAYHLAYQGLAHGEMPFYALSNIPTMYLKQITSEGLGSKNTVRGTLRNRINANGYAWSNMELRIKLVSFDFINQHWYVATNPFFDMGIITDEYEHNGVALTNLGEETAKLHSSVGAGLKIVMNHNFIISAEKGQPLNKQDGPGGMAIGLNYIF